MYQIVALNNQDPTLAEFERLDVYYTPTEINQNRESSLATIDVIGRNNPIIQTTGGNTTLAFQIEMIAREENKQDVIRKASWLQSLTYKGSNGIYPLVKLVFGELYEKEVWRVKSCNIKYKTFDQNKNYRPTQAMIDITLQLANEKDLQREEVY